MTIIEPDAERACRESQAGDYLLTEDQPRRPTPRVFKSTNRFCGKIIDSDGVVLWWIISPFAHVTTDRNDNAMKIIDPDAERVTRESQANDYLLAEEFQPRKLSRLFWPLVVNLATWALVLWFAWWIISNAKADPITCGSPKAEQLTPPCEIEQDANAAWKRCEQKTGRFNGTKATAEQRDYMMFHCGLQAGIWLRRDP